MENDTTSMRNILLGGNDFVSNLKIYCDKRIHPHPLYEITNLTNTRQTTSNFQCRVTVLGQFYDGQTRSNKKAAKQSAAQVACLYLADCCDNDDNKPTQNVQLPETRTLLLVDVDNFPTFIKEIDTKIMQQMDRIYGITSKSDISIHITGVDIIRVDNTKAVHLMMAMQLGILLANETMPFNLAIVAGDKLASALIICLQESNLTLPLRFIHCKKPIDLSFSSLISLLNVEKDPLTLTQTDDSLWLSSTNYDYEKNRKAMEENLQNNKNNGLNPYYYMKWDQSEPNKAVDYLQCHK